MITGDMMVDFYRKMVQIRYFEEKINFLFSRGRIRGTTHLYVGQEAVAVGVCSALKEDDLVVSTHRGHGHAIAKGLDMKLLMAELFGKEGGCCRGRGGTQHLACFSLGFLGTNGITGGGIPIACGSALACRLRKTGQVTVSFFGDGATNQGVFHETLNIAALWKLPIVFVCENNLYAMSTHIRDGIAVKNLTDRAKGDGVAGISVDGNDVLKVREAAIRAVEKARSGDGPMFLECKTYRFLGHSKSDIRVYRTREEEASWMKRCPIKRLRRRLIKEKILKPGQISELEEKIRAEVEEAVEFAEKSPLPSRDNLYQELTIKNETTRLPKINTEK